MSLTSEEGESCSHDEEFQIESPDSTVSLNLYISSHMYNIPH